MQSGPDIGYCYSQEVFRWEITKDNRSGVTKLEHLDPAGGPSGRLSWQSPNGNQVTDDGWILSAGKKWLLWLPPHWQSDKKNMVWSGQFLALLHHGGSEVIIMELPEDLPMCSFL